MPYQDKKYSPVSSGVRSLLGQGLALGWGDEIEAGTRAMMSDRSYDQIVDEIRKNNAQFASDYPTTSVGLEFAGGVLPGVAAMFIPGGQALGTAQLERAGAGALAKLALKNAAIGSTVGGIAGAGQANEGNRMAGAGAGAVMGGVFGAGLPLGMRGIGNAGRWAAERLNPSKAMIENASLSKMSSALRDSNMTPEDMKYMLSLDRAMGVPSVIANAGTGLSDLAETVAQRSGAGARNIEKVLGTQKAGIRDRVYQQTKNQMRPGEYYDDLDNLILDMKTKSQPLYDQAYSVGEVKDPKVLEFFKLPQFQKGISRAQELLAAEGRDLDMSKPTVEVLDQVKRGLDGLIEKETDSVTGKVSDLGRVYTIKKNEYLKALDEAVPEYKQARDSYRGDAEIKTAMQAGMDDFNKLDPEQVKKMIGGFNSAEREAFKTGAARNIYGMLMNPSNDFNAAKKIINSPNMRNKLEPLFDSKDHFDLYKNALERESQLFTTANKILGGSQTGKRAQMREEFEDQSGIGEAIKQGIMGNVWSSLGGLAMKAASSAQMSKETAEQLSKMLMSSDPREVALVVNQLEEYAAKAAPKALRTKATETGAVSGLTNAIFPSPMVEMSQQDPEKLDIESALKKRDNPIDEIDIEEAIKRRKLKENQQ
jgi:hypothetical protein